MKMSFIIAASTAFVIVTQSQTAKAELQVSTLELGSTTVKPGILLQGWAIGNERSTVNDQSLRLRRAEIKLSGVLAGAPKYFMMIDPAKLIPPPNFSGTIPAKNMIQDFGLTYAPVKALEVTAGQFKIPTTAEGLDPSADLPLPERSLSGRTFGDRRELGARVAYKTELWSLASMVATGQPITVDTHQELRDLHSRLDVTPVKGLGLGAFLTLGNEFDYSEKGRWGMNARYRAGDADLRIEYAQGKDRAVHTRGYTVETGYYVTKELEPVFRYETFQANQNLSRFAKAETIGVNYRLSDYNSKLQIAGTTMQNMQAPNGSVGAASGKNNKLITLVLQTSI